MRDQHRPKQDLISEVIALRKQMADLREAMTARRRVEDALRLSEEQLRMLVDAAPVGLCLFRPNGTPLVTNRPFARLLGYDSTAELLFPAPEDAERIGDPEQLGGRVVAQEPGEWPVGHERRSVRPEQAESHGGRVHERAELSLGETQGILHPAPGGHRLAKVGQLLAQGDHLADEILFGTVLVAHGRN